MDIEEKEQEQASIKARYEYYKNNRKNVSKEAEGILNKIREGYIPNEADVFELLETDQNKINQYRKFYKIKDSISKDGRINQEDLNFLIKQLGIDEQTSALMEQQFKFRNKIK